MERDADPNDQGQAMPSPLPQHRDRWGEILVGVAAALPLPMMALTLAICQPLLYAALQHGTTAITEAGQVDRILFGGFALAILCALAAIVGATLLLGQRTRPVGGRRALLSINIAVGLVELVGLCVALWLAIVVIEWGRY